MSNYHRYCERRHSHSPVVGELHVNRGRSVGDVVVLLLLRLPSGPRPAAAAAAAGPPVTVAVGGVVLLLRAGGESMRSGDRVKHMLQ